MGGGDAQDAGGLGIGFGQFLDGVLRLAQDHDAAGVQAAAGFRRFDAPGGAHEQAGLQLGLQLGDLLADHRLGDAQAIGGLGEGAGVDHGGEIGEAVEVDGVHGGSFYCKLTTYSMSDYA